ncbi:threonine deaminase, partial [Coemansia erecta]
MSTSLSPPADTMPNSRTITENLGTTTAPASGTSTPHHGANEEKEEAEQPDYLQLILNSSVYDVASETPLSAAQNLSMRTANTVLLKREDLQPVFS